MIEENIDKEALKKHRLEKEEKSREKIKEFFMTGQVNPKVAVFALYLLGVSTTKAKELIKQWTSKK